MKLSEMPRLAELEKELTESCNRLRAAGLNLDLTRGKPAKDQLALASSLDGILQGDYMTENGTDTRNYGGVLGIPEARRLGAELLDITPDQIMAAGNSSLSLMYLFVDMLHNHGIAGTPWRDSVRGEVKFLCPVPGYDRHFAICEQFGIRMLPVPLTGQGPDMDQVETLVSEDPDIKGIWCVPRYSNPTGEIYSDEVVQRMARLPGLAGPGFQVIWDNAYFAHHLTEQPASQANILKLAEKEGSCLQQIFVTASTSKITHAGAGISFAAGSPQTISRFAKFLGAITVGHDKVNQLRHVRLLKNAEGVYAHMKKVRQLLKPKFELVEEILQKELGGTDIATWSRPEGGYFVSFNTWPGLAGKVVKLAGELGVKLTPAGATFPYGKDPQDSNIRIAPSFPPPAELKQAMEVFVTSAKLVAVRQLL